MRTHTPTYPHTVLLLLALALSSCAAPRPSTETPPSERPRTPVTRTVSGFRIQILTTNDQAEADDAVEDAIDWYGSLSRSSRPPYLGNGTLDVDVVWRAPYYRVQIGSFATRTEADHALQTVARRFPDAFPVPSTVTVTR